ncbi:MAG: large conductance mechanosensitive channel protein MscL [Actinomycetia bacterium]|nr:large conductance mechanosensitive channel protein MscL [Actinomycetes bacterium]
MREYFSGLYDEFKEFISRGNIIDVAVGVIIGGAFTGIINSLVAELFMPLIGLVTGGVDFSTWTVMAGEVPFRVGAILTAIINFFVLALLLFVIIKALEKMRQVRDLAAFQVGQVLRSDEDEIEQLSEELHPDNVREDI